MAVVETIVEVIFVIIGYSYYLCVINVCFHLGASFTNKSFLKNRNQPNYDSYHKNRVLRLTCRLLDSIEPSCRWKMGPVRKTWDKVFVPNLFTTNETEVSAYPFKC